MTYVTGFIYKIEEYEVPSYPGLLIVEGSLDISISRLDGDLDFNIIAVELEKADGTMGIFTSGSFIYDALVPHLNQDQKFRDLVMAEAIEHI